MKRKQYDQASKENKENKENKKNKIAKFAQLFSSAMPTNSSSSTLSNHNALSLSSSASQDFDKEDLYRKGEECGQKGDFVNAKQWYAFAAELGHVPSQYKLGCLYVKSKEHSEALKCFTPLANRNYPPALWALAAYYERGIVVEKNPQLATNLRSQAAFAANISTKNTTSSVESKLPIAVESKLADSLGDSKAIEILDGFPAHAPSVPPSSPIGVTAQASLMAQWQCLADLKILGVSDPNVIQKVQRDRLALENLYGNLYLAAEGKRVEQAKQDAYSRLSKKYIPAAFNVYLLEKNIDDLLEDLQLTVGASLPIDLYNAYKNFYITSSRSRKPSLSMQLGYEALRQFVKFQHLPSAEEVAACAEKELKGGFSSSSMLSFLSPTQNVISVVNPHNILVSTFRSSYSSASSLSSSTPKSLDTRKELKPDSFARTNTPSSSSSSSSSSSLNSLSPLSNFINSHRAALWQKAQTQEAKLAFPVAVFFFDHPQIAFEHPGIAKTVYSILESHGKTAGVSIHTEDCENLVFSDWGVLKYFFTFFHYSTEAESEKNTFFEAISNHQTGGPGVIAFTALLRADKPTPKSADELNQLKSNPLLDVRNG